MCKLCLKENRIRLADVVHHIIELKERRELGLEKSNLLFLYDSCYKKTIAKYKKGVVTKKNTQEELLKLI
ncbi:HNH endonuclease [Clostridium perfringens]|uniref:HNH endonuclease n=1 Tax=Clostridium perfringens TaxID=1502 RepID=UPI0023F735EB|nr:HNH endonuclease [Clostridium perfringens]MDM0687175.1 HNH endonuclease [Clostridium perfringens]WEV18650.1 HNH endonuclease [Clostridium perfringens D]